jgi:hypothetical protein
MKVVGCQPYAPAAFTPRINLVHIFRGSVDPREHGTVRRHGNNIGDTGNRCRDLPTCSAVRPVSGIPERLNYHVVFIAFIQFTNVAEDRGFDTPDLLHPLISKYIQNNRYTVIPRLTSDPANEFLG